jgi:hypothetical protein
VASPASTVPGVLFTVIPPPENDPPGAVTLQAAADTRAGIETKRVKRRVLIRSER